MKFTKAGVLLASLALLVVVGAVLVFVDFRQLAPPSAALSFEAAIDEAGTISVDGTTDLPDGTVIDWDLVSGPYRQPEGAPLIRYGQTTVNDGAFRLRIAYAGRSTGELVSVGVRFYPAVEQPQEVYDRFGPNGERLQGPGVVDDSGTPVLVVVREVVVP
jgi:hypothetical protein